MGRQLCIGALLTKNSDDRGEPGWDSGYGAGIVNLSNLSVQDITGQPTGQKPEAVLSRNVIPFPYRLEIHNIPANVTAVILKDETGTPLDILTPTDGSLTFSGLNPKTKYQIVASNEAGESLPLLVTTTKKPVSSGSLGGSGGGNFVHDVVPPLAEDPPVSPADLLDTLQVTIQANGSYQFLVEGNNDTENIQIEVTDPAIAAVTLADGADPRGAKYRINAKTAGTTEIQVTYQGQTSVLKVTVSEPKASLTLDTTSYTLAPGQQYTIGAILKDENGSRLTTEQIQNLIDNGKLIVRDSRTGSVFDLKQLPNGNFQVTGKQEGTGYVIYEIGGVHASVAITVQNDILPHGDDTRNTIFWSQLFSI